MLRAVVLLWLLDGEAMIMRTCTKELDFKLPLVNNVCQKENDGFGYLCMCGNTECNSAATRSLSTIVTATVLGILYS